MQPCHHRLFFHAFDAVDGGQAVALGKQGQAFNNRLEGPPASVEDGADRLDKRAATNGTLIALDARETLSYVLKGAGQPRLSRSLATLSRSRRHCW
jgi:hypothetical protein